jgi:phosphatidylserine synthase
MERTLSDTRPMPVIAAAIVLLTLTTAYIHFSLGGVLFTLNAAGYAALAVAMIVITAVPHPFIRRFDWAPRIGLAGYAALTIGAYLVIGPYFTLGWVAKAIEIAIITLVLVDLRHAFDTPARLVRAALDSLGLRTDSRRVTVA